MAETEVASPPQPPVEEIAGKGRPERPRREPEDVPDMSVEEAHKALNALPKPEPQPENEEHEQQVAAINEDIKKIKARIEVLKEKIDEAQKDRGVQMKEMDEARNVMRELKEERDGIRGQLNAMQEVTKSAKATLEGHDKSKRALQSSLKYRTVEEIEQAIKKMESRQQTSSMSLSEEKKLVKEIEQLKQSKKTAAQYVSQEEALGKAKDGYNATRKTESEKKAELKVIQDKIKLAHARLEELNKVKEEEGEGVNSLYEEKKSLHEEINDKIEEIKELRKAHTAKLDAWYALRRERAKLKRALQKAEWMERQAAKEARNKAIEEEEARKIPYESEMVLCDTLVSYLETTFLKGGPVKPTVATHDHDFPGPTEFNGVKVVMMKRQDEDFIVMGGGKKRGGSKKKAGGKNAPGGRHTIVHAIDTMESFSLLSIAPPPNKAAVPDAIKALKAKKAWFKEQPRPTPVKQAQAADKGPKKQAPKVKPPDINDAEFPGLPGMIIKPKVEATPAPGEAEGNADGDAGEEEKASCDKPEVEAPSAASIVANGVSGKMVGSDPKVEPKSVPEEVHGGKQEGVGEEAGDAEVEKPLKETGEACDGKAEAKEDGDGKGGKEGLDAVMPKVVQNGEEGGVEKPEAGGDGDEE